MSRWRIGITIGLHTANESLWSNGIKQNAIYLAMVFQASQRVASVRLVNTTAVPLTGLPWDTARWPAVGFDDAKDDLDVLIELGGQVDADRTAYLKARGTRLVSYCCGVEYINFMESALFDTPGFGHHMFVNQRYDALWVIPQVEESSRAYFETLRRIPAQVVPFVWSPVLLEQATAHLPHGGQYRPRGGPARLAVMEPNHNVVKFCLNPVFIAEQAFRQQPDAIELLQVTNAERMAKESPEFIALMTQLDIVRQHKAVFLGRHMTGEFISQQADAVISHQWSNALNYFYFDVCWQGYPLVHNAHLCAELGYYYPGSDVPEGARQLLHALATHPQQWQAYQAAQRQHIARFLPDHPGVVAGYESLLQGLLEKPLR